MKLCKKLVFVLVALVFSSFITAYADNLDEDIPPDIPEPYIGVTQIGATLSISTNGIADCNSYIRLQSSYTAMATLVLQKQQGSTWIPVIYWTKSDESPIRIHEQIDISSGYYYRVVLTADVYDGTGNNVETASVESSSHYY